MAYDIKKVAVLGLGTLGAQMAAQAAAVGYEVYGFDPDKDVFNKCMKAFLALDQSTFRATPVKVAEWPEAAQRITMCDSLEEAVGAADLVLEVVPENLEFKTKIWARINAAAKPEAILATNSSSMPVSKMEGQVDDPTRVLNIHFYRMEMGQNMADVMGGTRTVPEVISAGRRFVIRLGLVPLKVKKELLGFCFNRVWRAIKRETLYMWGNEFVDFKDIDRAYMIFNDVPWGPFGLMDAVGLDVVYDIEMVYYNESKDPKDFPPQALKDKVEAGELGVKSGRGFYSYPDPEYTKPEFLEPKE